MPTVLSRMAMQLKKTAWIIPVFMVSGCSFVGIIYTALFALYAMLFWLAFF